MEWTRREFVAATLAVAGGAVVGGGRRAWARPRPAFGADTYFDWKQPAPGVHVAFGEGGNAMAVPGKGGALLVDCKNAPFGAALRREADALGTKLTVAVNTHHHADHTAGNYAFTPDLPVYAHEKAKPRVLAQLDRYKGQIAGGVAQVGRSNKPAAAGVMEDAKALAERADGLKAEDFAPTRTLGDHEELEVGGRRLALHQFGPGHTDNDLVVHLPDLNIIHTGDLLFHRLYPFWDPNGGVSGAGWIKSLESTLALCNEKTVVIPGHGEITDRSGVQGGIDVLKRIRDAAGEAIKAGKSKEDFVKTEIPEFKDFGLAQMAKPRVFAGWYDELSR